MNNVWFPEPVTLKFSTTSRNVATSFEALECLDGLTGAKLGIWPS